MVKIISLQKSKLSETTLTYILDNNMSSTNAISYEYSYLLTRGESMERSTFRFLQHAVQPVEL